MAFLGSLMFAGEASRQTFSTVIIKYSFIQDQTVPGLEEEQIAYENHAGHYFSLHYISCISSEMCMSLAAASYCDHTVFGSRIHCVFCCK